MSISLSGVVRDGYGEPIPNARIRFNAIRTTADVMTGTSANSYTDSNGSYTITVQEGRYDVYVHNGSDYSAAAQNLQVRDDTTATTLNELLLEWQGEQEVTPEIVLEFRDLVDEARGYRDESEAFRDETLGYKNQAAASATAAAASESNASDSEQAAATSESNAASSERAAAQSESNASDSAAAAAQSESNASDSEQAAATSEDNASDSEQAAAQSESNAAASEAKARDWAMGSEDTPVEPGEFSAMHWAKKAQNYVTGTLRYMGTWDPGTGAYPSSPTSGDFYKVSADGDFDGNEFRTGDQIVFNGTAWDHIDNTERVFSVGGYAGAVTDSQLLAAIKRVDGSGSGLDADLLDGQSGGFYRDAGNLNAGTVDPARLPAANTGDIGAVELATNVEAKSGEGGKVLTADQAAAYAYHWVFSNDGAYYQGSSGSNIDEAEIGDFGLWSTGNSGTFPSGSSFWLISTQKQYNNGAVVQVAYSYHVNPAKMSFRNTLSENPRVWSPWSEVWTNQNQGAGSGLDADLLDGRQLADIMDDLLAKASNLSDLPSKSAARSNLDVVQTSKVTQQTGSTGASMLPSGPTADRPSNPGYGHTRGNTDIGLLEWWNGSSWQPVGSGATGGGGDQVFVLNDQVVTESFEIPAGKNAHSVGPITVQAGATVTVPSGSIWEVSGE